VHPDTWPARNNPISQVYINDEESEMQAQVRVTGERTLPHGGVRPFHQKSTCLTQLTLGRYVVQIWSRYARNLEPTKPSNSTEWH